ncbi:MAG: amidase [Candidatus Promineifilaceae bacterium]
MNEICNLTATEMAAAIRGRKLSAREVMEAHLTQIEAINSKVNAIPTLLPKLGLYSADLADEAIARGDTVGPLHGLPIAHKDLTEVKGVRTTYGSPIFTDHVPSFNSLIVERLQNAGAITIGKTNTPEFGAGSHTFNPVHGLTRNPYNLNKTCGGSSGGAAVALATRMLPIADGSDMGGSLRNPAAFNNVVGFRPSPGRVPSWPKGMAWGMMGVEGPMARTVEDIALMLTAMAGPDKRSPIALNESGSRFTAPLERDWKGTKIAWSENLGGMPVDPEITRKINQQVGTFKALGLEVASAEPNLTNAQNVFHTLRAHAFASAFAPLIEEHSADMFKETIHWNTAQGVALSGMDIARAQQQRTVLYHQMCEFMDEHHFMVCPVTQVLPFDITTEYPTEVNGVQMESYIHWMQSCYFITVLGFPAISVPCGFSADGLPVGLQIVGRHQDDFGVLQLAYAYQQATEFYKYAPIL